MLIWGHFGWYQNWKITVGQYRDISIKSQHLKPFLPFLQVTIFKTFASLCGENSYEWVILLLLLHSNTNPANDVVTIGGSSRVVEAPVTNSRLSVIKRPARRWIKGRSSPRLCPQERHAQEVRRNKELREEVTAWGGGSTSPPPDLPPTTSHRPPTPQPTPPPSRSWGTSLSPPSPPHPAPPCPPPSLLWITAPDSSQFKAGEVGGRPNELHQKEKKKILKKKEGKGYQKRIANVSHPLFPKKEK